MPKKIFLSKDPQKLWCMTSETGFASRLRHARHVGLAQPTSFAKYVGFAKAEVGEATGVAVRLRIICRACRLHFIREAWRSRSDRSRQDISRHATSALLSLASPGRMLWQSLAPSALPSRASIAGRTVTGAKPTSFAGFAMRSLAPGSVGFFGEAPAAVHFVRLPARSPLATYGFAWQSLAAVARPK